MKPMKFNLTHKASCSDLSLQVTLIKWRLPTGTAQRRFPRSGYGLLGNMRHWVIIDSSGELYSGKSGTLYKVRGLWDLPVGVLNKQWPDPAAPAKEMITLWILKVLTS